jgi:hypothetical protein
MVGVSGNGPRKGAAGRAKPKTKTEVIDTMAKAALINKKRAKAALGAFVAMTYKGDKNAILPTKKSPVSDSLISAKGKVGPFCAAGRLGFGSPVEAVSRVRRNQGLLSRGR